MKILVISSCTNKKSITCPNSLTKEDFENDDNYMKKINELSPYLTRAEDLYNGEQHKKLLDGINYLRNKREDIDLDFYILSAGYGLIKSDTFLLPYDITFCNMNKNEISNWSNFLHIPSNIENILNGKYDFIMLCLGEEYLEACNLEHFKTNNKILLFCSKTIYDKFYNKENFICMKLSTEDCTRYGSSLISLKGLLGARLLKYIANNISVINDDFINICNDYNIYDNKKSIDLDNLF